MMARTCDVCQKLIEQKDYEYLELQVRVLDATEGETQDEKNSRYGDFCDPCIRSGAALTQLLTDVGWKLDATGAELASAAPPATKRPVEDALHDVFTRHGIASRSAFSDGLICDLIHWAADECRAAMKDV